MPARRLLMRKLREFCGSHERGVAPGDSPGLRDRPGHGHALSAEDGQSGLGWPLPADLTDAGLEARLFRRPAPGPTGPTRLRAHPRRAQAQRGHAAAALGGVPAGPSLRLPLHPVLRDLPAVGAAAAAVDAAGAPRRREDLHRLLGQAAERWSTGARVSCGLSSCSSPCSAPAASPTPRRPRPSSWRTGSPRTSTWSSTAVAPPRCGSPTS